MTTTTTPTLSKKVERALNNLAAAAVARTRAYIDAHTRAQMHSAIGLTFVDTAAFIRSSAAVPICPRNPLSLNTYQAEADAHDLGTRLSGEKNSAEI